MEPLHILIGIAVAIATIATMYFSTEFDRRRWDNKEDNGGIKV